MLQSNYLKSQIIQNFSRREWHYRDQFSMQMNEWTTPCNHHTEPSVTPIWIIFPHIRFTISIDSIIVNCFRRMILLLGFSSCQVAKIVVKLDISLLLEKEIRLASLLMATTKRLYLKSSRLITLLAKYLATSSQNIFAHI